MTPTEVKSVFKTQNNLRNEEEPFIYVVRGYDINNNSDEDRTLAEAYGFNLTRLGQNDRLVIRFEPFDIVIKDMRHYQLFDFIDKFPRVKPANNTGHALTNRLVPVFQAVTRLMLNQYYLNDNPTMPGCAHSLKPKVAA